MKKQSTFSAVVYREDGLYIAECVPLGVASQGESMEEALSNLKEAVELYLEEFPHLKTSQAFLTTFEVSHA